MRGGGPYGNRAPEIASSAVLQKSRTQRLLTLQVSQIATLGPFPFPFPFPFPYPPRVRAASLLPLLLLLLLPSRAHATEYAPYFYTWSWDNPSYPFKTLVELEQQSGLRHVTLAFVLAEGGCSPSRDIDRHLADVSAFRKRGGRVRASFGGASGTSLEMACPDPTSLGDAIGAFVERTGIADLDFDVEQAAAMTPAKNLLRAQALARIQARSRISVSFTLAATAPGGLSPAALDVVKAALSAGIQVSRVNLMTMGYAATPARATSDLAVLALSDAHAQIRQAIPGLGERDAWSLLGVTPMIGKNGPSSSPFTLADARALTRFAREKGLGLLSFWAIQRDRPGSGPLSGYSGAQEMAFAFHQVFADVARVSR